jgi:hypothetical protein
MVLWARARGNTSQTVCLGETCVCIHHRLLCDCHSRDMQTPIMIVRRTLECYHQDYTPARYMMLRDTREAKKTMRCMKDLARGNAEGDIKESLRWLKKTIASISSSNTNTNCALTQHGHTRGKADRSIVNGKSLASARSTCISKGHVTSCRVAFQNILLKDTTGSLVSQLI